MADGGGGTQPSYGVAAGHALRIAQIVAWSPELRPSGWPEGHLVFARYAEIYARSRTAQSAFPAEHRLADVRLEASFLESAAIGRVLPAVDRVKWRLSDLTGPNRLYSLAPYNQYWLSVARNDEEMRSRCLEHMATRAISSREWDCFFTTPPKQLARLLAAIESRDEASTVKGLQQLLRQHGRKAQQRTFSLPEFPNSPYTEPELLVCLTALALLVRCAELGMRIRLESPFLPTHFVTSLLPEPPHSSDSFPA